MDQVVELAGAGGRGSLGRKATDRALAERRVDVLLLSKKLGDSDPEYAERCVDTVDTAFEQDATVEELVGHGAEHLDQDGQGVCARLRFTI